MAHFAARSTILGAVLAAAACGGGDGGDPRMAAFHPGKPPAHLERGSVLYASYCASCHGVLGKGQGLGPALLDTLFLPETTPDAAMIAALRAGAPQRRYHYGAMPAATRVDTLEMPQVVAYVRWLQQAYHGARGGASTGAP
ncbi:MAG: cytochrome c [Gemmatimonadetes bacterium]|nr:cytochrome c [Gemmatimonadota bacterium]MBP6669040.1 cytochrome c [Gemmatimonadales bacterium]MBK6778924.1 cytochrome c [Gemmatimonadota bacterium]MBK7348765.1 cytochrome c [Gemmatimonadota bacterium]MBK7714331.1 cytochrome c [Gemmatimonadota bacterium]